VVGVGASAGGLEALIALVSHLDAPSLCCVVLQHLAPDHTSVLPELLSHHTRMRVCPVSDGLRCEAGVIYVGPPNAEVTLRADVLHLEPAGEERPRRGIDAFFRSLAASCGPRGIGVILSGTGSDGTEGLRAIKDAGGRTYVQEPASAGYPEMPNSAIASGCVEGTLRPAAIAEALMSLPTRAPPPASELPATASLFTMLTDAFGVDFARYKPPTVERRLRRRMALHGFTRLDGYVAHVEAHPEELKALYGDLLIGVTAFFRDRQPFERLASDVLPKLLAQKPDGAALRVWVAGCATGEEAYSVAMVLSELSSERASQLDVQIFASDVDDEALAFARIGHYPPAIARDVSAERLAAFFVRTDAGYQVRRRLRDLVVFAHHNLGTDPPFSRIDLVSCRNALIYMGAGLQAKVVQGFHYALLPAGYLLLGGSESVGDGAELFSLVDRKAKLYQKKSATQAPGGSIPSHPTRVAPPTLRESSSRPPPMLLERAPDTEAERVLRASWDYLQSTIEDFQLSQAELRTTNEALQSTNEELQSTNEELETSKEELQSTNEELVTINEQLHGRMAELDRVKAEHALSATVLARLPEALAVLDASLRLTWANPPFSKLFELDAAALGRPFRELWQGASEQGALWSLLERAAERGESFERTDALRALSHPLPYALSFAARRLVCDAEGPSAILLTVYTTAY